MSDLEQLPPLNTPGISIEVRAALEANTRATVDLAERMNRWNRDSPAPTFYRAASTVVVGATGIAVIGFGGPDQGNFWYVRSITVGGLTRGTAAAGVADVYVLAANPGQTVEPTLSDFRDRATSLPNVAFYGRGELPLRLNEELWIRFSAATNTQQYVAAIQVEQYQEHAGRQSWVI